MCDYTQNVQNLGGQTSFPLNITGLVKYGSAS